MQIKLSGIVLRQFKSDKGRVLHVLTAKYGVITVYANGTALPRSPMAASTELLCYCDFILFHSKDKYIANNAETIRIFFGIRQDIEKLALASYLAQISDELCPQNMPADDQMRLLLNTLHYIEKGDRPLPLLKAIFELRMLSLSGFMPNLIACSECACYEDDIISFSVQTGHILCGDCCTEQRANNDIIISPAVLAAMRHIIYSPNEKLFTFTLNGSSLDILAKVTEEYLIGKIEKTFTTLAFYHSLGPLVLS